MVLRWLEQGAAAPTRRSCSSPSRSLLLLLLLLAAAACFAPAVVVEASVIGVDLGSEFIKIAAPSGNTIDIALNDQSLRKTSQFVGFRGAERYFGEEARNLLARFPDNMVTALSRLVGVPFNDTDTIEHITGALMYKQQLAEHDERKTVSVRVGTGARGDEIVEYTAEELLGMIFTYIKAIAEKHIEGPVREAIVTVPYFFTPRQRQAVVDSAALAGIRVIALMHSTTATAHQYGIQNRGFGDETRTVMFYDMGATSTEVGIYTFSPTPTTPKRRKPKFAESLGTITTLSIVADPHLGGRSFDACIAEMIENEFVRKTGLPRISSGETLAQRKAVVSLMRAANKAKEVLSANKQAHVTVEGIAPDRDFSTVLTREAFEQRCGALFDRAVEMVRAAVDAAGIEKFTIQRYELMGGAVRVPKLLNDLGIAFGRLPDRTLNSDEAAAVGAGYYAASISGFFRSKGFAVKERLSHDVLFQLSPRPERPGELPAVRPLFVNAFVPSRKSINVNRTSDFEVRLMLRPQAAQRGQAAGEQDAAHDGSGAVVDVTVAITGVNAALESVGYFDRDFELAQNNSHVVKVELRASESGLTTVQLAEAVINVATNVSKKVRVNKTAEEIAEERAAIAAEEEKDKEKEKETEEAAAAAAAAATPGATAADDAPSKAKPSRRKKSKTVVPFKIVRRSVVEMKRRVIPLTATPTFAFPQPLHKAEAVASRDKLRALNAADDLKRATSAAKNDLETYLLWARGEGVLDNPAALEGVSGADQQRIRDAVAATLAWLEDDVTDATTREEFLDRLRQVRQLVARTLRGAATGGGGEGGDTPDVDAVVEPEAGDEPALERAEASPQTGEAERDAEQDAEEADESPTPSDEDAEGEL